MATQKPLGVLLMAYGTPKNLDEVESYYTHIRRGNPPTPEQLQDLKSRYAAIGGVSPLNFITSKQAIGIESLLNTDGGRTVKTYLGNKHAYPYIVDAVEQMVNDGVEEAVGLVLAPHYSTMSVGTYQKLAIEASINLGAPKFALVDCWHLQPRFLNVLTERVREALDQFQHPHEVMVIFSAHSLPARILTAGDKYPSQLRETAEAVAAMLHHKKFMIGWQSAGRTAEPWLGPDILDELRNLHEHGEQQVIVCSCGFVADHLEVLYDVDIECKNLATQLGMHLERTRQMNDDSEFLRAVVEVIRDKEHDLVEASL